MIKKNCLLALAAVAIGFVPTGRTSAAVLVNDTWADGTRTNQNLPTDSAWFNSSGAALVSSANGYLSLTNQATSSSEWTTYFTPVGTPSQLTVGDTLTVTLEFKVQGIPDITNNNQNMRFGLVNSSSGGVRVTSDANIPAANYTGYSMFGNWGPAFGRSTAIDLRRRTNLSATGLLGTSGDWAAMGSGGAVLNDIAFTNNGSYTFTMTVARTGESEVTLSAAYSGGGLTNALTRTDTTSVYTNFDCFVIRPTGASTTVTNLIITRFKVDGPAGTPPPPSIVVEPQDITRVVGTLAPFSVGVSGGTPLRYQWYYTNVTITPLANQTNAALNLLNVQLTNDGGYFVIVTNAQGAATSRVGTLTVTLPTYTSTGVIVDDVWADGDKLTGPIGASNTVWVASTAGSLVISNDGSNFVLSGLPNSASSRTWVGYFVDDPANPVDLAVGRAIRAKLFFTPNNVADKNTSSIRFGLFNYADGGNRLASDGFASTSTNVIGYMLTQNFGTNFGDDTPMELYARINLAAGDLVGSTGDFSSLGAGLAGSENAPAFISGTEYTLEFTVTRTAEAATSVTTRFTGGALDIAHTHTDTANAYRRFDAFGIRPNRTTDSAEELVIKRFLVEVIEAPVPVTITAIERPSSSSAKLTWSSISNRVYQVQSRNSLATGGWTTNATITATASSTSYTNTGLGAVLERYYRVVNVLP